MKKSVGIFLVALMLVSLGGCGTSFGTIFAGQVALDTAQKLYEGDFRKPLPPDKDWVDTPYVEPEIQKKSDFVVCAFATKNGKWETRVKFQPYVKEAKNRKLTCDVK